MNIETEIKELENIVSVAKLKAKTLQKELSDRNDAIKETATLLNKKGSAYVDTDQLLSFFAKPYAIIPQKKDSVLVAVPKFVKDFQVGWLWKETESFYIYQFDQYSAWLGDAPQELLETIGFEKGLQIEIQGNVITFSPEEKSEIKKKLGNHLGEMGDGEARIKRGHIFDVIAETVKNGCLPFKPIPVASTDLQLAQSKIKLRPYQQVAYKKFLDTGAVGIFHPTGAGKSFVALHALETIKGKKLLVVPARTLIEQWEAYIEQNIPHAKKDIKLVTYQGFRDSDEKWSLVVYDECQRLPADTFSRLATVDTKYRMGLSASPHREDGREHYIFALTGFPVGLNWREYMETVGKSYHPIHVHPVRSSTGKLRKLDELLNHKKKTLIFCDTIALGKEIAKRYGVPYIYGETNNRLAEIEANNVVCISRVGDLGMSIKNLQRIIEVDFLFGSRQQELQRTGRLMHSEEAERHDIIMTESELQAHGKRLWALQEKGFSVKVV